MLVKGHEAKNPMRVGDLERGTPTTMGATP
jgi:hypothetical protein